MSILFQDRRGQRDPRKRPRARGAIMARPRCKPHRPFYFLWGNTASRASGPVVKVAAASRANAPVRKCGVKYQVSWWEQPDIPCRARIVYDTEGRVVDMVRGSLMHAARLGAGTAVVIAVLGLSGCAFNPLSTFTTPTIDQIERETVTPTVSDDALVTPGTLTVASIRPMHRRPCRMPTETSRAMRSMPLVPSHAAWVSRSPLSMRLRPIPRSAIKRRTSSLATSSLRAATSARLAPVCTMPPPYSARAVTASR